VSANQWSEPLREPDRLEGDQLASLVGGTVPRRGRRAVIEYPSGQNPTFWDPIPGERTHRFALGNTSNVTPANPPLIALCMNPSHADETSSDRTVNRLIAASQEHGYPGWIMLNVYPQRSSKPSALSAFNPELAAANCAAIERVLTKYGATEVLGAWGDLKHEALVTGKAEVLATLARLHVRVFSLDRLTKRRNPRHPNPQGAHLPMEGPKIYLS
jgi:hypothetical protein